LTVCVRSRYDPWTFGWYTGIEKTDRKGTGQFRGLPLGSASRGRVAFLDRGLPDCLFFYRNFGLDPNDLLAECFYHRYASVFLLDRLDFQLDSARVEDDAYTVLLDKWLYRDYTALGYHVIRVPVLPPQERLEFILEKLAEQRLLVPA
jgi:predicted ATPase